MEVKLVSSDREAEIVQLSTVHGQPVRQRCVLDVSQATYNWWSAVQPRRQHGEVVLFIRRHNGNLILHSKDFYPVGTLRVPSGGIKEDEPLLDAAHREALEETGLQVAVERFLAVVEFEFRCQKFSISFPSYLFLLRELGGELKAMDADEHIVAFAEVAPDNLTSVAQCLENVPQDWCDWGQFRAFPHRLAAELLAKSQ